MDEDDKIVLQVGGIIVALAIVIAAICFIGMEISTDIEIRKAEAGITNCKEEKE